MEAGVIEETTAGAPLERFAAKRWAAETERPELPRPKVVFIPEMAAAVGVSPMLVNKWIRTKKIKATKFGHRWRIPITEVERIVREMEHPE